MSETTDTEEAGRNPADTADRAETPVTSRLRTNAEPNALMEAVLSRSNMMRAYQRVLRNKGAADCEDAAASNRWLDKAQVALHPVAAVETPAYAATLPDAVGPQC